MTILRDEFGNAEIENQADAWEEKQKVLANESERVRFDEIAKGLTDKLLVDAFGIAYHLWQKFGDSLRDDMETEAYKSEILSRFEDVKPPEGKFGYGNNMN